MLRELGQAYQEYMPPARRWWAEIRTCQGSPSVVPRFGRDAARTYGPPARGRGPLARQEDTRRILVVEADRWIGEVITQALETAGFAVQIAPTATAALEALGGHSPDAILVDLAQPDEQGWEFLARCRQQPGCKNLPIGIMSTTLAEVAAAGMARERGACVAAHAVST